MAKLQRNTEHSEGEFDWPLVLLVKDKFLDDWYLVFKKIVLGYVELL